MPVEVKDGQCQVVVVGCGLPNRGMGWYHCMQMMDGKCPHAALCYIVEPWFLGAGAEGPGGSDFAEFKASSEGSHGVEFFTSVGDLPPPPEGVNRLALISGRTADNPKLLKECIDAKCHTIYLEKPGAPTVAELKSMQDQAKAAKVTVLMGYNKNVTKYVQKAREYQKENGGTLTFVHNNAYENTPESLGECFERNAEGMLKNMAIHELALLVTFFDVTVANIESVEADKKFSSLQTLKGPSGKEFTDFDKIKFKLKTKSGKEVSLQVDRCGGEVSWALVEKDGEEVFRHNVPDEEDKENVKALEEKYPGAMPYFYSQDPDYITVKERVAAYCATGAEATDIATIEIGVETLRVAEHLTPTLQKQLGVSGADQSGCCNIL